MISIWTHARNITPLLVNSLSELEVTLSLKPLPGMISHGISENQLRESISTTWLQVISDAERSSITITDKYLSTLHQRLASAAGAEDLGTFLNREHWNEYVESETPLIEEFGYHEDAHFLSTLFWGAHLSSLALSVGWLCSNGLRLQQARWALYPLPDDHCRLVDYLRYAGPDTFDAEALRALIGEYENTQQPTEDQ